MLIWKCSMSSLLNSKSNFKCLGKKGMKKKLSRRSYSSILLCRGLKKSKKIGLTLYVIFIKKFSFDCEYQKKCESC